MKKVLSLFVGVLLFGAANAQNSGSEVEMFQSIFSMEKKAMVAEFLNLSDTEAGPFWDLYNAYESERADLGKRRITLLQNYVDQYNTLDDESGSELLAEAMKLQISRDKVKNKYTNKIKKAVGAKRAAQFYQLENYIDSAINLYLMDNLPFVGELD